MKRSEVNKEIEKAKRLFESIGFKLPPFAFWTTDEWAGKGRDVDEIVDNRLGRDVTDFGCGSFFPAIEEDEKPIHLLCTEYKQWLNIHSSV